tara:strand:+ start:44 stop:307 length:264 start_codon:yes stop_codon:yes gene_type:complete
MAKSYDSSFGIVDQFGEQMSLGEAFELAKEQGADLGYDPQGLYNGQSWSWCLAVLSQLLDEELINSYEVLKPNDVEVESSEDEDVKY